MNLTIRWAIATWLSVWLVPSWAARAESSEGAGSTVQPAGSTVQPVGSTVQPRHEQSAPPASPPPGSAPSQSAAPPGYAPPLGYPPPGYTPPPGPPPGYTPPPGYPPPGYAPPPGYPPPGYGPPAGYAPGYGPPYAATGYPVAYPPPPVEPEREPSFFIANVSAGLGVPYGVLGGAINLGIEHVTLMAGGGTTVVAGAGFGLGLRLALFDTSHKLQPHFTAVWGTTAGYKITGAVDMKGTLHGFGFYGGLDHDFGRRGEFFATYGLGVITHEELPESVTSTLRRYGQKDPDMGIPIKAMAAIGYRFGGH